MAGRDQTDIVLWDSVADAKQRLRDWAVDFDAELDIEVERIKAQAIRFAPWALGAGLVLGLLKGFRPKRATAAAAKGAAKGTGWGMLITVAIKVLPMVIGWIRRRKQREVYR